ncbi:hypothetical protein ES707_13427 [subsurface metagenome]
MSLIVTVSSSSVAETPTSLSSIWALAFLRTARMSSWMAHITWDGPDMPFASRRGKSWFSFRR